MKVLIGLSTVLILLLTLQNCGSPMESDPKDNSVKSVSSYYPYKSAPSFFADAQVVDKLKVDDDPQLYSYRLIATAVSAGDEDANIDIEIHIMDSTQTLICPRIIATINRATNHLEINDCMSSENLNSIIVKTFAGLEGSSLQEVRSQFFDLENLSN